MTCPDCARLEADLAAERERGKLMEAVVERLATGVIDVDLLRAARAVAWAAEE